MKRSTEIEAITHRVIAGGSDMEMMRRLYSDSADLIAVGTDDGWGHGPAEVLGVLEYESDELVDYDREGSSSTRLKTGRPDGLSVS